MISLIIPRDTIMNDLRKTMFIVDDKINELISH